MCRVSTFSCSLSYLGWLPLKDIAHVHFYMDKNSGRRFELECRGGRNYVLSGDSRQHAREWAVAISNAVLKDTASLKPKTISKSQAQVLSSRVETFPDKSVSSPQSVLQRMGVSEGRFFFFPGVNVCEWSCRIGKYK